MISGIVTAFRQAMIRLTVRGPASQQEKQYTLVGQEEADLKNGKISVQSPVGRALIGRRVGDLVEVAAPAGTVEYEIQEIRFEEL